MRPGTFCFVLAHHVFCLGSEASGLEHLLRDPGLFSRQFTNQTREVKPPGPVATHWSSELPSAGSFT